eukprot:CAMPEP_0195290822 /NCGR_PEP_ID=MMETSP0707-20130614/6537_1 /TAXON_ID=33640 /ORGANISM="Asterionellopsis glacialis, Strain CCMP134" /LENGTH=983 /DNA_ID=CAMNT_0040351003 /DNA_START=170 /DNA_END=3121 /DNA_ORIENTATION=-
MAPKPTEITFVTQQRSIKNNYDDDVGEGSSRLAQPRLARKASDRAKDRYRNALRPTLPTTRGRTRVFRTTATSRDFSSDDPIDDPILEESGAPAVDPHDVDEGERCLSFSGRKKNPWTVEAQDVDPIWDQLRRSAFYGEKKPHQTQEEEKKDDADTEQLHEEEGATVNNLLGAAMYPSVQRLIGYPTEKGAMYSSVQRLIGYPSEEAMYPSIQSLIGYPHTEKELVDAFTCGVKNMVKYWEETLPTPTIDELEHVSTHSFLAEDDLKDPAYPTVMRMLGYPVETGMYESVDRAIGYPSESTMYNSVQDTMGYPVKEELFDAEQTAIMAVAVAQSALSVTQEGKKIEANESTVDDGDVVIAAAANIGQEEDGIAAVDNSDAEEKEVHEEEKEANSGAVPAIVAANVVQSVQEEENQESATEEDYETAVEDITSRGDEIKEVADTDGEIFEESFEKEKSFVNADGVIATESATTTVASESEDDSAVVQEDEEEISSDEQDEMRENESTGAAIIATPAVVGAAAAVGATTATAATTPVKVMEHTEQEIGSEEPPVATSDDNDISTSSIANDNELVACTPMKDVSKEDAAKATPPTVATSVDSMSPLSSVSVSPNPAAVISPIQPRIVVSNGTMRSFNARNANNKIAKPLVIANGTRRRSGNTGRDKVTALPRRSRPIRSISVPEVQPTPAKSTSAVAIPSPPAQVTPLQPRVIFGGVGSPKQQDDASVQKGDQLSDDSSTNGSATSANGCRMDPSHKSMSDISLNPASNEDPYVHARSAGTLWQSLVGQHVRLPPSWWNGARCPSMGCSLVDGKRIHPEHQWNYVDHNRFYENEVLDGLVHDKNSAGRLLLHLLVRTKSSALPLADIVVGCYHPCHEDIEATNAGECRVLWLATRSRAGWDNKVFSTILGGRKIEDIKNKNSPLEEHKAISNKNLRAIFGDNPPVETVHINDEDLQDQITEELDGLDTPMSFLLLEMFLRGFAAEC